MMLRRLQDRRALMLYLVTTVMLLLSPRVTATEPAPSKSIIREAKRLYLLGIAKYQENEWALAVESLRESAQLFPLPLTYFNIALCERSLGHYVRARQAFEQAIERLRDNPKSLTVSETRELREYMRENDGVVSYIDMTVLSATVALTIDGRPLEPVAVESDVSPALFLADTLPPGAGTRMPSAPFVVRIDPGSHVLQIAGEGLKSYSTSEVCEPGHRRSLSLRADRLPVALSVNSDRSDALVTISNGNLGTVVHKAPFRLEGESGRYVIVVDKPGFVGYRGSVDLKPGDRPEILAKLPVYKPPIYKRWWFWTAAGAAVAAAVGLSVGLSLGPPAYEGGSSGWVAHSPTTTPSFVSPGARGMR